LLLQEASLGCLLLQEEPEQRKARAAAKQDLLAAFARLGYYYYWLSQNVVDSLVASDASCQQIQNVSVLLLLWWCVLQTGAAGHPLPPQQHLGTAASWHHACMDGGVLCLGLWLAARRRSRPPLQHVISWLVVLSSDASAVFPFDHDLF
jgi:hypothetical protein